MNTAGAVLRLFGQVAELRREVQRVGLMRTGECRKECVLDVPRSAWLAGEDTGKSV